MRIDKDRYTHRIRLHLYTDPLRWKPLVPWVAMATWAMEARICATQVTVTVTTRHPLMVMTRWG